MDGQQRTMTVTSGGGAQVRGTDDRHAGADKEIMLARTHIAEAPWWIVEADDKRRARLNCIAHLLKQIDYEDVRRESPRLPDRVRHDDYQRQLVPENMYVPDQY